MYCTIGRHAGRAWGAPGCNIVGSRTAPVGWSFTTRRFASNLSLPALDRKWRLEEEKRNLRKEDKGWWSWFGGNETKNNAEKKGKMYILPMFPYPSGDLHLGHLRVYTISDVLSRFRRMQGYDVMHPIGWDAFGLPAENAAIERGIDPASWTKKNIEKMKTQLEAMNGHWDWDREFATSDPSFYKHTQQLFLLLHKAGLAYQDESLVNYDPVDKTVLANEQVDANGISWRSGAKVEQRMLKQWFFKISAFRQELLDDLEGLAKNGAWPERVLAMQKNWLGKSTGAQIKFPVIAYDQNTHADIEVFTTRPDTLFGVQYVALASTHSIVKSLAKTDVELQAFLDTIPALPPDSKVGYLLPHVRALNPLAYEESTPDATKASLPIYVAPYVLGDYGDGAVMGVPGHDIRDHAFWKHNRYDDPVRMVISPSPDGAITTLRTQPFVHHGHLTSHSGQYAGQTSTEATSKIVTFLESKGLGSESETWRLRDWLISRQRYWGTPIPIIHCDSCGAVPVPEDQLPVELPPLMDHWGKGKAGNPLDEAYDWVNTSCPSCGGAAKRETDTMDTFVDSSWYFTRFPDPKHSQSLFSPEASNANLPVDLYIGGVEHAILHLLYARFISKFLATTPLWPNGSEHHGEPFKRVLTQGMVHGKTYTDPNNGRFLKLQEVYLSHDSKPMIVGTKRPANVSFQKMSKSKYNGVDPSDCIEAYGADAVRAHILFQAPVSEVLEWDEDKIAGITRWLHRLHAFIAQERGQLLFAGMRLPGLRNEPKNYFIKKQHMIDTVLPLHARATQVAGPNNSKKITQAELKRIVKIDSKTFDDDKKLWRTVQSTISSVTHSYAQSYSLNTVVSDLMTLTNAIIDHGNFSATHDDGEKAGTNAFISRRAIMALLQMMAPITPAFAEECWSILHPRDAPTPIGRLPRVLMGSLVARLQGLQWNGGRIGTDGAGSSVFDFPFPTTDGTFEMLGPTSQSCAVQVNGKLRLVVEIPVLPANLEGKDLETWIVEKILLTSEGKKRLGGGMEKGKPLVDIRKAKKAILVKGGKTVNFVV